jgi:hypothetical protein
MIYAVIAKLILTVQVFSSTLQGMQMVMGDSSYKSCIGSVYQTIIYGSDGDQCLIIYEHLQQNFKLIYFHVQTSMYMKHSHLEGCRILGQVML